MADKPFDLGPVALTNTYTTNILNPAAASGGVNGGSSGQKIQLRQLWVANKTGGAVTFRLWKGATGANAAGTELFYDVSVPANTTSPFYVNITLTTSDFLVGGASAATSLTLYGSGVVMVA